MQRKIKKNFAKIFGVILSLMMIVAMMPNVSAAIPVDNTLIINDGSVGNENELHKFYFSGDWTFGNNGACYNGDEHYIFERQINDTTYISIAFEGTGIELYASLKDKHGMLDVYLDDIKVGTIDQYRSTIMDQEKMYSIDGLEYGRHIIKLVPTGQKNELSKSADVQIDYAKVLGYVDSGEIEAPKYTEVEDSHTTSSNELFKIQYIGNWIGETGYSQFHNGDDHYSDDGGSFKMDFIGEGIEIWASTAQNHGNYDVYIDGQLVGEALANTESRKEQQKIFEKLDLVNGKHTIEVKLQEASSGKSIQVDYLKVYHDELNPLDINLLDTDISLETGESAKIEYELYPINASNKNVKWTSSDESIVKVDGNTVTAIADHEASAKVTVTIEGTDISKSVNIHVVPDTNVLNAFVALPEKLDTVDDYDSLKYGYGRSYHDVAWKGDILNSKIIITTKENSIHNVRITASDFVSNDASIAASNLDIRWIKDIYIKTGWGGSGIGKYFPDCIHQGGSVDIEGNTVKSSWININIPKDAKAGTYRGTLTLTADELTTPIEFDYEFEVLDLVQPTSNEVGTTIELWQYPFATAEYYGLSEDQYFTEEHFKYLDQNIEAYKQTGGTAVTATIVEEAWNHQSYYGNPSMIKWTKKADGSFTFDYTWYDKWIQRWIDHDVLDPEKGIGEIQCYSIVPWGNVLTYMDEATGETVKQAYTPGSEEWNTIWRTFLEDFMKHTEEKGWLDITYISMDERGLSELEPAVDLIKSVKGNSGKTFKIFSAFNYQSQSNYEFTDKIDDISVGLTVINHTSGEFERFVEHRKELGLNTTVYTCTGMYPNSFSDDDPVGSEWTIWYSLAKGTDGFLRWAFDNWVEDQLNDATYSRYEPGDCFFIYPAEKDGSNPEYVYSTPRYEMLKKGIRDINKAKYLMKQSSEMENQVKELVQSLDRPSGKNTQLMLDEVERMRSGIMELSRTVIKVDKIALQIAVDLADQVTDKELENVVPVVVEEFKAALQEAKEILADKTASQEDVDASFDRLASVMQKLEFFKGDKTALKAFIDKVSGLDSTKYSTDTWTAFDKELTEANIVYNDENAMQEEVNSAYKELVTVFLNLRLLPDKSLLEDLINKAEGLNSANYTKASFDGLTKALNEAKVVFENPNATQEQVDNAKAVLEKAIAGLQTVTTDNTVKTPVNNGDTTTSVKTGDESLAGMFASIVLLSVAGYTVLKRKLK